MTTYRELWATTAADVRYEAEVEAFQSAVTNANDTARERGFGYRDTEWYEIAVESFAATLETKQRELHIEVGASFWAVLEAFSWSHVHGLVESDEIDKANDASRIEPFIETYQLDEHRLRIVAISSTELAEATFNGVHLRNERELWAAVADDDGDFDPDVYVPDHDQFETVFYPSEGRYLLITGRFWFMDAQEWRYVCEDKDTGDRLAEPIRSIELRSVSDAHATL